MLKILIFYSRITVIELMLSLCLSARLLEEHQWLCVSAWYHVIGYRCGGLKSDVHSFCVCMGEVGVREASAQKFLYQQ